MGAKLRAIVPKRQITTDGMQERVNQWFRKIAIDFRKEMQVYPPQKNKEYRRKFRYRKGWNTPPTITNNSVTIVNTVPYAGYVGGPKRTTQSRKLRRLGWRSTTDVIPFVVSKHRADLDDVLLPYRNVTNLPGGSRPRR